MASAAPPVRFPNVYGIDMPSVHELVAHGRTEDELCTLLGADRLVFQDLEDLIDACVIESGESMKEEGSSAVEYPAFFHPSTLRSASSSVSPAQTSPS